MIEFTEQARQNMLRKYAWAEASVTRMQERQSTLESREQHFWAFLTACQTIRFYHGAWFSSSGQAGKATEWIDKWKLSLVPNQLEVWDAIREMRNLDTHTQPLSPSNDVVQNPVYFSKPDSLSESGYLMVKSIRYVIVFKDRKYPEKEFCRIGLAAHKKFVDDFDHNVRPHPTTPPGPVID